MPGIDLDAVAELDEPAERVEEPLGALARLDREVGPRRVADEERVAGEDDPRIGAARAVADREAAVLRPVAGRVDAAQDDVAERRSRAVLDRVVRVLGVRGGMDAHRDRRARARAGRGRRGGRRACASRSTRTMRTSRRAASSRYCSIAKAGSTTTACARPRIADDVGGTPERVVDELREDHGRGRPYQRVPLFLLKYPREHGRSQRETRRCSCFRRLNPMTSAER